MDFLQIPSGWIISHASEPYNRASTRIRASDRRDASAARTLRGNLCCRKSRQVRGRDGGAIRRIDVPPYESQVQYLMRIVNPGAAGQSVISDL